MEKCVDRVSCADDIIGTKLHVNVIVDCVYQPICPHQFEPGVTIKSAWFARWLTVLPEKKWQR